MFKKIITIFIVIVVIAGLGYWVYQSIFAPEEEVVLEGSKDCVNDDDCVVFGETGDCNCGCYNKDNLPSGTGGECFCAVPTSCKCVDGLCEGVFEEEPLVSKEEAIEKLLAEKYNKEVSEITININKETENHLMGGVKFGEGGPGEEGGFLAAKTNGNWKLVYDGIGAIFCSDIEPYDFPVEMVIECWDEETGKVKDRAGEACVNSGGVITTSLCCKATSDYPNLCLVGPCGCSPDYSHQVKVCNCEEGKCFDGNTCVPEINSFDDCVEAGYAILPPTPGGYTECRTPDGKVFSEEIEVKVCAEDGDTFSTVVEGHLDSCCEGLKEWFPIPDTRFSIADVCYEIGQPSESNIGLCIKCGDGICESHPQYDENPCNCPEDCAGKNKSHFSSIEEFCQSNDWKISLSKACEEQEPIKGSPICELCTP